MVRLEPISDDLDPTSDDLDPTSDSMEKVVRMDEMVAEIAKRIPPSDPAFLVRFALACKSWQGIVTNNGFLRAYAQYHGRVPLLGYFHNSPIAVPGAGQIARFVPAAPAFPSFSPNVGTDNWYVLDVRQGRSLLLCSASYLIVWLPMSGEHFLLPEPPRSHQYQAGAVICAESPQCKEPDCFSNHSFRVIFIGCDDELVTYNDTTFFEGSETWACIYSQEEEEWGQTYILKDDRYTTDHPLVEHNPPVLYRDSLYFTLDMHQLQGEEVRGALKFDLTNEQLSVVLAPEEAYPDFGIFLDTSQGVAFAGIGIEDESDVGEDDEGADVGQNSLSIWTLTDRTPPTWTFSSEIDLEVTLPAGAIQPAYIPSPVGFFVGEETTVCIDSGGRIYAVEVDSLKTTDLGPSVRAQAVLPYLHFYTPSLPKPKDDEDSGTKEPEAASEESDQKTEDDVIGFTEDEGTDALQDRKNPATKADVIGTKRGTKAETPSGKKAKVDQSGQSVSFSGADESSSSEDSDQDSWV